MRRHLYREAIGPQPPFVGPKQAVTFIPLERSRDPRALACARAAFANGERVVFDCGWSGGRGMALLGFEVVRRRGRFVTLIGFGQDGDDYTSLEEAVQAAFLTGGSLE